MLIYTKLYTLLVIVATALSALWIDRQLPYFPIEISRFAGSGGPSSLASQVFKHGLVALPLIAYVFDNSGVTSVNRYVLLAGWVSLQIVTHFDDVSHWGLHMIGVAAIGTSAVVYCALNITVAKVALLLGAGCVWAVRLLLKCLVIVIYEVPIDIQLRQLPAAAADRFRVIMYQGASASQVTILAFKIAGVGQWIVFFMLSFLI